MGTRKDKLIKELLTEIELILKEAARLEKKYAKQLSKVHPNYKNSAYNLLHYRAMRMRDLRDMQKKLRNLGLSRLANAESHVLSNLLMNKSILIALKKAAPIKSPKLKITAKKAIRYQKRNSKDLLGYRSKGRRTRIMVTLPSEAGFNEKLVYQMIDAGMNCCRINCSHDNTSIWKAMAENTRVAEKKLKNKCKITMDLAGPKIRTGHMTEGPKIKKIRTTKNVRGEVEEPTLLWLSEHYSKDPHLFHIPIEKFDGHPCKVGDRLYFRDTRRKKRQFKIASVKEDGIIAECMKTSYVETGMNLFNDSSYKNPILKIGPILPLENFILLNKGDFLRIDTEYVLGEPAKVDDKGHMQALAHIACTWPDLFKSVKPGEVILFDDGTIRGKIKDVDEKGLIIEIIHTKSGGAKLKADKGINFPASDLKISGLTEKDKEDLKFAVKYADTVNMSFVNHAKDVSDLIRALKKLGAENKMGIILKIETQRGYHNLLQIILEGMRVYPLGIMIARGDLAVETGWDNIARIQEEILALCQSAHIPDIWATQVLENLAKSGIPSRAEISDTVMAQRADCIMLNKGPYILNAIQLLHTILKEMKPFYDKSVPLTPVMEKVVYHA